MRNDAPTEKLVLVKRRPIEERFWAKVEKTSTCWLWQGYCSPNGYGSIGSGNKNSPVLVHRLSYEIYFGEIPDGLLVLHKCNIKKCVNPGHLKVGTNQDNTNDALDAGNIHQGSKCWNSKLTERQVITIRKLLATGDYLQIELADLYNVSDTLMSDIKTNKVWRHIL